MAETKREKAQRYLAEGRLRVFFAAKVGKRWRVVAECRGDSGEIWKLGHDPRNGEWRCTCPANREQRSHPDCSHLLALKLVVSVDVQERIPA